ncbi:MAG: hypothetical protein LBI95_01880 [Holosporales bacterium]|nr:hypothetical protein [Holosporales bacterium]
MLYASVAVFIQDAYCTQYKTQENQTNLPERKSVGVQTTQLEKPLEKRRTEPFPSRKKGINENFDEMQSREFGHGRFGDHWGAGKPEYRGFGERKHRWPPSFEKHSPPSSDSLEHGGETESIYPFSPKDNPDEFEHGRSGGHWRRGGPGQHGHRGGPRHRGGFPPGGPEGLEHRGGFPPGGPGGFGHHGGPRHHGRFPPEGPGGFGHHGGFPPGGPGGFGHRGGLPPGGPGGFGHHGGFPPGGPGGFGHHGGPRHHGRFPPGGHGGFGHPEFGLGKRGGPPPLKRSLSVPSIHPIKK